MIKRPEKLCAVSVWCNYKGAGRWVHPAVCEWHIREQDPQCRECPINKKEADDGSQEA